jgi:hypothetical protein
MVEAKKRTLDIGQEIQTLVDGRWMTGWVDSFIIDYRTGKCSTIRVRCSDGTRRERDPESIRTF